MPVDVKFQYCTAKFILRYSIRSEGWCKETLITIQSYCKALIAKAEEMPEKTESGVR